jgi:uncharacterized protein YbbK (DUF523 family)
MSKIKIGISSCLLGKPVRYDGKNKQDRLLTDVFSQLVKWIPVCPEAEYGLPVPREEMRLYGNPDSPRLITINTKADHTKGMQKWGGKKIRDLKNENLCGFIFKSRSPSCGIRGIKVYPLSGKRTQKGAGLFAGVFTRAFPIIPAEDDVRLHDPYIRNNFIERFTVFKKWQDYMKKDNSVKSLISFHTDHKLLIQSHSPAHYRSLGKIMEKAVQCKQKELFSEYIKLFMEGLKPSVKVNKNTSGQQ